MEKEISWSPTTWDYCKLSLSLPLFMSLRKEKETENWTLTTDFLDITGHLFSQGSWSAWELELPCGCGSGTQKGAIKDVGNGVETMDTLRHDVNSSAGVR